MSAPVPARRPGIASRKGAFAIPAPRAVCLASASFRTAQCSMTGWGLPKFPAATAEREWSISLSAVHDQRVSFRC